MNKPLRSPGLRLGGGGGPRTPPIMEDQAASPGGYATGLGTSFENRQGLAGGVGGGGATGVKRNKSLMQKIKTMVRTRSGSIENVSGAAVPPVPPVPPVPALPPQSSGPESASSSSASGTGRGALRTGHRSYSVSSGMTSGAAAGQRRPSAPPISVDAFPAASSHHSRYAALPPAPVRYPTKAATASGGQEVYLDEDEDDQFADAHDDDTHAAAQGLESWGPAGAVHHQHPSGGRRQSSYVGRR